MSEQRRVEADAYMRLDQLIVQQWPVLDRKTVRRIIQAGDVLVNDQPASKAGQYVQAGDMVYIELLDLPPSEDGDTSSSYLPLKVAYEDNVLLVVDKPEGMAMRTSTKYPVGTLVDQLAQLYPDNLHIGGVERAGVVMRVEPEISGLVLVAKDKETYRALQRLVKRQHVERVYSALVEGHLRGKHNIAEPIGNVKRARRRMAVAREGRPARTSVRAQRHYKEGSQDYTLLDVRPETSRLHQIRVHLSWYGFPIVGDRLYGTRRQPILPDRIFLHLSMLTFPHPVSGDLVRAESILPPELYSILQYMARPKF